MTPSLAEVQERYLLCCFEEGHPLLAACHQVLRAFWWLSHWFSGKAEFGCKQVLVSGVQGLTFQIVLNIS